MAAICEAAIEFVLDKNSFRGFACFSHRERISACGSHEFLIIYASGRHFAVAIRRRTNAQRGVFI